MKLSLLGAVAALAGAGCANATVFTQNIGFDYANMSYLDKYSGQEKLISVEIDVNFYAYTYEDFYADPTAVITVYGSAIYSGVFYDITQDTRFWFANGGESTEYDCLVDGYVTCEFGASGHAHATFTGSAVSPFVGNGQLVEDGYVRGGGNFSIKSGDVWEFDTPGLNYAWGTYGTVTYTTEPVTDPDPISPVPEPASWALLAVGFGAIGGVVRRRRKSVISFS